MKIKAMKWLTTAPVALALAVSLAACGSGSAEPSGTPTDALAGSDQQTRDKYTTADVTPVDQSDTATLGLNTEGKLEVGTLSDAPPNIFIDPSGKFTGYDNELLRAIAGKLGLEVEFVATAFSALLSQVLTKQFDVGSSSISTTDARPQNVRNGQVDAWVAPSQQATGQVKEGDGTVIAESVVNTQNFTAYAVAKDNQPLIDALNSGLDAVIADGTWSKLTKEWYPDREMPADWKPGSKAATVPQS